MGMFDFLNGASTPSPSDNWVNPDTNAQFGGGMDTITKLLQDPNVLQGMGNAGEAFSKGATAGEALNPANLIRQIQSQKAGGALLKQILAGAGTGTPTPTPLGMPGPDAVTTKKTADGTTTTIQEPSAENLSTFGTSVPMEAMSNSGNYPSVFNQGTPAGGGADQSPFWKALFQ